MSFLDQLPETLREIAEVIGLEATIALVRARGGTSIYIPAYSKDDHWLTKVVGKDAADALCAHFRVMPGNRAVGAEILLPIWGVSTLDQARAQAYAALEAAEAEGLSGNECVRRSGLSLRTVRRHRARRKLGASPKLPLLELMSEEDS